jgi:hypothetical protein
MFTPGLAIFYFATILRSDHVCDVHWSHVWRKSMFLKHSIGRRQHAGAWELSAVSRPLRQGNMDRASQVLAQGVPKSYRALADHSNVPHSTLYHRAHGNAR